MSSSSFIDSLQSGDKHRVLQVRQYNNEFVSDGVNGFLCDTFDIEAYIKAILSLSDPVLRTQMSKQSYLMSKEFAVNTARKKVKLYLANE